MPHSPYSNKKVMEDWLKDLGVLEIGRAHV